MAQAAKQKANSRVIMKHFINIFLTAPAILLVSLAYSQSNVIHVKSPNGKIDMALESGSKISWSVKHENTEVIAPSAISLTLGNGGILG